jgi:alanyl-tRNA synthetase
MHVTARLYYLDAYRTEFSATVVERSPDGRRVYLDETAFYPTSGGQPHDVGTLAGRQVVDVIDEDDRIAHVLAAPLEALPPSATVIGAIDWRRRFDHMQQHTGQHLLSAVFEDLYRFKTVSVHFGPDYSTLDLDVETVTRDQLIAVEDRANAIVTESRPVTVSFEDAAAATEGGLRKASSRVGTLRIVTIEGLDRSACGGTHVRSTAEIGTVLVRSTERVRKSTRVEFVCGARAVHRARHDYESLSRVAGALSASLDDAANLVGAQAERLRESDAARKRLEKELAGFRARALYQDAPADAAGVRTLVIRDASSMDELKTIAQAALALQRAVVVGVLTSPASVLVAASDDSGVDAGRLLKEQLGAVGGRGGGSPRLAQGSVPDASALEVVVAGLISRG